MHVDKKSERSGPHNKLMEPTSNNGGQYPRRFQHIHRPYRPVVHHIVIRNDCLKINQSITKIIFRYLLGIIILLISLSFFLWSFISVLGGPDARVGTESTVYAILFFIIALILLIFSLRVMKITKR